MSSAPAQPPLPNTQNPAEPPSNTQNPPPTPSAEAQPPNEPSKPQETKTLETLPQNNTQTPTNPQMNSLMPQPSSSEPNALSPVDSKSQVASSPSGQATDSAVENKKKEIYTYTAPWTMYAMNWSVRADKPFRLAVGSFIEEYSNKIEVIQLNESSGEFSTTCSFEHPYPPTKLIWAPAKLAHSKDLLASTGDYLRLWSVDENEQVKLECMLNNNTNSKFCAPLTSFDWNETDPSLIGTSSIDTTCTIWNIETRQAKTQLIAHDKEVYDIAFAPSTDVFASVGADGSVRMFDLRSLEHSTIIYESPELVPLLRLCWNKQDHNYLATFPMDQSNVIILDIRAPSLPVAELKGHSSHASVNAIAWAPHSSCHICTAGEDSQALIWDLAQMPKPVDDPILAYTAESEVNSLQWSTAQPDWVAIAFDKKLQILRV